MRRTNKEFMTCKCDTCTERRELMEANQKYMLVKFRNIPRKIGCTMDEWLVLYEKHKNEIPQYVDRNYLKSGMSEITTYYPISIIREILKRSASKELVCAHLPMCASIECDNKRRLL